MKPLRLHHSRHGSRAALCFPSIPSFYFRFTTFTFCVWPPNPQPPLFETQLFPCLLFLLFSSFALTAGMTSAPECEESPSRRRRCQDLLAAIARDRAPRRARSRLRWPRAIAHKGLRTRARARARRRRRREPQEECPRRSRPSSLRDWLSQRVFAQQRRGPRRALRCSCVR